MTGKPCSLLQVTILVTQTYVPQQCSHKAMCDNNMSVSTVNGARMQDCALDAVYNQTLMTPTAILIFKFRSSTVDQLKNILHLWRTDKTGQSSHAPQMMSSLVLEKDWGSGGQIISKTVPCSQIPEKFKYQNLGDCEQMGDSGVLLAAGFMLRNIIAVTTARIHST